MLSGCQESFCRDHLFEAQPDLESHHLNDEDQYRRAQETYVCLGCQPSFETRLKRIRMVMGAVCLAGLAVLACTLIATRA